MSKGVEQPRVRGNDGIEKAQEAILVNATLSFFNSFTIISSGLLLDKFQIL
jgi:hypothetical protein